VTITASIRIGLVGVGNCAAAIVQALAFYRSHESTVGLARPDLGGCYGVADISVACAFDVDDRKVGEDLATAILAPPNNARRLCDIPPTGVVVQMGPRGLCWIGTGFSGRARCVAPRAVHRRRRWGSLRSGALSVVNPGQDGTECKAAVKAQRSYDQG
jgi:hypothetical protein